MTSWPDQHNQLYSEQLRDVGCSVKEGVIVGSSQGEGNCRLLAVLQMPRGGSDDQAGDSGSAQETGVSFDDGERVMARLVE